MGRTALSAAAVACYALFTPAAAALAQNVWELGVFRFFAGVGIGGEWAVAGTYVAEVWPESRPQDGRRVPAKPGYYVGFFSGRGTELHRRRQLWFGALCFLCGGAPVLLAFYMLSRIGGIGALASGSAVCAAGISACVRFFAGEYRRRTCY